MEISPHTTERSVSRRISEMSKEAKSLQQDVLYSEKGHFSVANVWERIHLWLGIPASALAALAGISALTQHEILAAVLAIGVAVLTALITFLEPHRVGAAHHSAGTRYNVLRGKLRRFYSIDLVEAEYSDELRARLEALAEEKGRIIEEAPHIGRFAYWLAKRSIERGEHEYTR